MIKKRFLTGDYVIFSPERLKRPKAICQQEKTDIEGNCPFCLSNRDMLTDYLYEIFNEEIRIVDNTYPIIKNKDDFFGIHQVMIDTKEHKKKMEDFSDEHMFYLMKAIKESFEKFYKEKRLKYVQFFKNQGSTAGATLVHSHWQILGISVLPEKQQKILQAFKKYKDKTGKCYLCDLNLEKYKIEENEHFIAFCPENSVFFFEINIIPKEHIVDFKVLDDEKLKELGKILRNSIKRLNILYNNLDYNICLFNALREEDFHHFFFQIIPRLGTMGGYELSTGMFVNSILAENAVKILKEIDI